MTDTHQPASSRRLAGATVGIPPRQIDFQYPADAHRYFYANNGVATLFFAVLSAMFPPGEQFFVNSVKHYRNRIDDERLKAEIAGFIGQEALHGREHDRLNQLFIEQGIDTRVPDKAVRIALRLLERFSPSQQLACTTFMEHFTALMAEKLLQDEHFRSQGDPRMLQLWLWHALEELEHKSVAYDVYEQIGNNVEERRRAVPLVAVTMIPVVVVSWSYLILRDGLLLDWRELKRGLGLILGKKGFVTQILPKMPLFSRRRFHPGSHDTRSLESQWREKLFGQTGALTQFWKNPHLA